MHGFNVLVIKLVLLCGRHVSSGRPTGLIQNISNIKVKCLVELSIPREIAHLNRSN